MSARHSRRRLRREATVAAFAVGAFAVWMSFRLGGARVTTWVDDLGELTGAVIAGVACLARSRHDRAATRSWRWLGLSALMWGAGQAVWCWYELLRGVATPFPSLADIGYLAAIPLAAAGVLLFPGSPKRPLSRVLPGLDGLAVAGSLLLVSWATVLGAVYRSGGSGFVKEALSLAYPVGDVAIATIVLSVLARGTSRRSLTLGLIAAGVLALAFSDSSFAYLTQKSPAAYVDWVDTGWVAGFLLIAMAARWPMSEGRPREQAPEAQMRAWHIVVPIGAVAVAAIVGGINALSGRVDGFIIADGVVVLVIVLVRQALTLGQNLGLTQRLEQTVSELKDRERRLTHEALHDPLTGLANRVLFADRVAHALAQADREQGPVAVLFCDLDGFKAVNDSAGHAGGDELLRVVADRLKACVRAGDTVARLGGDEFAMVIEHGAGAPVVAERITRALAAPFTITSKDLFVHASIGVALAENPAIDADTLVRNADFAMYQAKALRGGGAVVFSGPVEPDTGSRLELESDLHRALERGEMRVHFQPVMSLESGSVAGFEALVRWEHPERGMLAPGDFIGIAESSGLIVPIGAWVLERSCRQLKSWQIDRGEQLTMAVNVSPSQLRSPGFVELVAHVITDAGLVPSDVCLELTESTLLEDTIATGEVLARIKQLGVRLAIDDFGIGYSTLAYLRRLPVDVIKVDQTFVADLLSDNGVRAIVSAVIHLANSLGLDTIAEGVETREQCSVLKTLGCHLAQGYYFAAPVDAADWWGEEPRAGTVSGRRGQQRLRAGSARPPVER